MSRFIAGVVSIFLVSGAAADVAQAVMPGTQPLELQGDIAAAMVAGISVYLDDATEGAARQRENFWTRDYSSGTAYRAGLASNVERLRRYLGVRDERLVPPSTLEDMANSRILLGRSARVSIYAVRWTLFRNVHVEGLLLEPRGRVKGSIVALGDCDILPEQLAGLVEGASQEQHYAALLAAEGYRVLVPALLDRGDTFSGNPEIKMTNQPHREFVYRPAYQMGRHIIGYEIQKLLSAVDWLEAQRTGPVGVIGYGEGGLVALYGAALDERIAATVVSGYFQPREKLWQEPIYRNVWGLLTEFGDAELAAMIAPRTLIIEAASGPRVEGPPPPREGRSGAAPGVLAPVSAEAVQHEVERARKLSGPFGDAIQWAGAPAASGSRIALEALVVALGGQAPKHWRAPRKAHVLHKLDPEARTRRMLEELMEDTQTLVRDSPRVRQGFWSKADASSAESWETSMQWYRDYFSNEVIGSLPPIANTPNAKTRLIYDEPDFTGYEVVLEVYPQVFAYGILCLPRNIQEGERRPVVVCQHGLEGRPQEVADIHNDSHYYHSYGARLAQEGFITFSPQNPYIGADDFRVLQRKANPLKLSLFSFIVRQHEQILNWLKTLPQVNPERMAFYGLSYGGKTAMRVPAILPDYCLSICSGDFNEWIWKTTSNTSPYSYLFTGEYEMFEFDLGNTFNYAEMSWLIFPRPFMVERGHSDGVAPDEWVAYEYARVRRHYDQFDLGNRTTLEFFNGPHTIHGVGTFQFLREQLAP